MLNLILGRQLSGKTKYCTDLAFKLAKEGKQVIMLVPEQYSFECQKLLLQELYLLLTLLLKLIVNIKTLTVSEIQ